ncbi:MAG: hypothetical protein AAB932_02725, partial [Patescibacteria group bacterium]
MMNTRKFLFKAGMAVFVFSFALAPFFSASAVSVPVETPPMSPVPVETNISAPQEQNSAVQDTPAAPSIDESLFTVVDELRDEADLGNGHKVLRVYKDPRLVYTDKTGKKKVRPEGWNLFQETAKSKIQQRSTPGYQYAVPMKNGQQVVVRSGAMQTITGEIKQSVAPIRAVLKQEVNANANSSQFAGMYPNVDVQFTDVGQYRDRTIIVKDRFASLPDDAQIIFWEHYVIPKDAKVLVNNTPIKSSGKTQDAVLVQFKNGEVFSIGKAKLFDS